MAREPRLIDLLREPQKLRFGDIIGVQSIEPKQLTAALNRSNDRKNPHVFDIPGEGAPRMRAIFMGYNYDPQDKDKVTSLSVMAMAPTPIDTRIENTAYTLMITKVPQKKSMGVDHERNWRLNYTPMNIAPKHRQLGVAEDFKVLKYGDVPPALLDTICDYLEKLSSDEVYRSHGFLSMKELRRLRGDPVDMFERITDPREINSRYSNSGGRDARAVEHIEERRIAELNAQRAKKKAAAAEIAKENLKRQNEVPSGRLAFKQLQMRFNAEADPDITLKEAHTLEFLSDDDFLTLEEIAPAMGISSMRNAYDAVVKHHELALSELGQKVCAENEAIEFKALLEKRLKSGLLTFFDRARGKNSDIADKVIPYTPPRTPEAP